MTSLALSGYLRNVMQRFMSPQRPLPTLHPIYLRYTDLSTLT